MRNWIKPQHCEVVLAKKLKCELIAPEMKRLRDLGTSFPVIASLYNTNEASVKELIRCVEAGEVPHWPARRSTKGAGHRRVKKEKTIPLYKRFSGIVSRLRHDEKMPFGQIAEHIEKNFKVKVSYKTVVRAFDYAHSDLLQAAAQNGKSPDRGRVVFLGEEKYREIRSLLSEASDKEIANRVGCGVSTVNRERKRLKDSKRE